MTKTAGIYTRISQDSEGDGLGVARQREDCEALAERNGWTVSDHYEDNDTSAFSGKPRKHYRRMLDDLRAGAIDVVIAWHPDRLHRSPRELEDFIALIEECRATVATVTAGDYDLSNPDARAMARIVGAIARKESEDKSRRLRRKAEELAKAGKVSGGGTRPFGFCEDRVTHHPHEAPLVREAARRVLVGEGLVTIARDWMSRGIGTVSGKPWKTQVLRGMLTSARIAGLRERDGVFYPAVWEPIVTRAELEQLRGVLRDPARNKGGPRNTYLLSGGLLRCGREGCGEAMVARPKDDRRPNYVCARGPNFSGCGKLACLAGPLEELVVETVLRRLSGSGVVEAQRAAAADGDDHATLLGRLREVEDRLAGLARDHYVDGLISRGEFLAAREPLEARAATVRRALARRSPSAGVLADLPSDGSMEALRAIWEAKSVDWRRSLLRAVLIEVRLRPAVRGRNRFDAERVDILPRDAQAEAVGDVEQAEG